MSAVPLREAARALGIRPGTLRRWCRAGAPVARPGRRGRGCSLLVDVEAIRQWRSASDTDAVVLELAAELPDVLARVMVDALQRTEAMDKRRLAGVLAATWYTSAVEVLDHLRDRCATVPEVDRVPEAIEHLRKIARG